MINLNLTSVSEHVTISALGETKRRFTFSFGDGTVGGLWYDGAVNFIKTTTVER